MKKYLDKFISYKSQHILITIGSILLILAHFIHLVYSIVIQPMFWFIVQVLYFVGRYFKIKISGQFEVFFLIFICTMIELAASFEDI